MRKVEERNVDGITLTKWLEGISNDQAVEDQEQASAAQRRILKSETMHVEDGQTKCAERTVGENSLSQALMPKRVKIVHVHAHAETPVSTNAGNPVLREDVDQGTIKAEEGIGKMYAGEGRQSTGKLELHQPIKIKRQRLTSEGDESVRRLLRCRL